MSTTVAHPNDMRNDAFAEVRLRLAERFGEDAIAIAPDYVLADVGVMTIEVHVDDEDRFLDAVEFAASLKLDVFERLGESFVIVPLMVASTGSNYDNVDLRDLAREAAAA